MATSSSSLPLRTLEDVNTTVDSCPFSVDELNLSNVQLLSDLQHNDTRHSEREDLLQAVGSASKLDNLAITIDHLPDELMLEIFSYVSFSENINVLQKVCTRWKIMAQDAELWYHKEYVFKFGMSEGEAIATFAAVPQLRTVILEYEVSSQFFEALSTSCPHLTTLKMASIQMLTYSEAENLFNGCKEIRTLTISGKGLCADAIVQLADLRTLCLHETKEVPLCMLADGCPHLCELYMDYYCTYWIREVEYFLSSHKHVLKGLRVRWSSIEGSCIVPLLPRCAEMLEHLELKPCFEDLSLEVAKEALTALGQLHNLRHLHFSGISPVAQHLVPAVFVNGQLPKLRQLHFTSNVLNETMHAVAKHCPELRELSVTHCWGHSDALFEPLYRLKKLEMLEIGFCRLLGGKVMSHIAKLPALHTLSISGVKFYRLKPSVDCILEMSGLRRLYFMGCDLRDIPFDKFPGRLVNLRELEIVYSEGDQEAVDRLSAQMPDLRVEANLGAALTDDSDME